MTSSTATTIQNVRPKGSRGIRPCGEPPGRFPGGPPSCRGGSGVRGRRSVGESAMRRLYRATLTVPLRWLYSAPRADVAQLARASACHAEGRGFESLHPLSRKPRRSGAFVVLGVDVVFARAMSNWPDQSYDAWS